MLAYGMAQNIHVALPMYLGTKAIVGADIERKYICSFRKQKSFNKLINNVKFGTDFVDSMLNIPQALYNIFHNGLIRKSLNNIWA